MTFILHVLHRHSISDTAKVVDKLESATRTLIHRARKNIKLFLCNNCSLYQPQNKCKCQNLINFSLKQGWIKPNDAYPSDFPQVVENELNELNKITSLYRTLPYHQLKEEISKEIGKSTFVIFSKQKVK
jgi:hypothetical protein